MATTKKKACCEDKGNKEQEEKKTRRLLVAEILKSAYFQSDQEREECTNIYAKSLLSIEEILNITEPLRSLSKNAGKVKSRIFGSNSRAMGGIA